MLRRLTGFSQRHEKVVALMERVQLRHQGLIINNTMYGVDMPLTLSEVRDNLSRLLDEVIKTGKPIELVHHGHMLKIVPCKSKSKLNYLTKHHGAINGSLEDLIHFDWLNESFDN